MELKNSKVLTLFGKKIKLPINIWFWQLKDFVIIFRVITERVFFFKCLTSKIKEFYNPIIKNNPKIDKKEKKETEYVRQKGKMVKW